MARLEEQLGVALFCKVGRSKRLTEHAMSTSANRPVGCSNRRVSSRRAAVDDALGARAAARQARVSCPAITTER
jgi:hypothetical protein